MFYNCDNAELDLAGDTYGWYGLDGEKKEYWAGNTGNINICERNSFIFQ